MDQYPNSIVITVYAEATQDATGKWTKGATTVYILACRAEANVSGNKIAGDDGVFTDFAYTVYLPKMSTIIPARSDYILTDRPSGVSFGEISLTADNATITADNDIITADSTTIIGDLATVMAKGKIKRALNGQLNSRLWL